MVGSCPVLRALASLYVLSKPFCRECSKTIWDPDMTSQNFLEMCQNFPKLKIKIIPKLHGWAVLAYFKKLFMECLVVRLAPHPHTSSYLKLLFLLSDVCGSANHSSWQLASRRAAPQFYRPLCNASEAIIVPWSSNASQGTSASRPAANLITHTAVKYLPMAIDTAAQRNPMKFLISSPRSELEQKHPQPSS